MRLQIVFNFLIFGISFIASGEDIPEVPKCCDLGQSLVNEEIGCSKSNLTFNPIFSGEQPEKIDLLIGDRCKHGKYRLVPSEQSEDEFHLLSNGYLSAPFHQDNQLSPFEYCLESFLDKDGTTKVLPLLCFPPPPVEDDLQKIAMILYPIGCTVSVPFLLLTVAIYLFITELRTTHGKSLCCYALCLALAYICLASVQIWGTNLQNEHCKSIAFLIQFFFVACFFWLNILCFHTWRRLTKKLTIKPKEGRKKRTFQWYSLYGWGFPMAILGVSVIMDLPAIPSSYIKPNFGLDACWFQNDKGTLSYFYGPISILLVANVIFFFLTMIYFRNSRKQDKVIHHLGDVALQVIINKRKQMFMQCVCLFCAMGIIWILEVISWLVVEPPLFWMVVDTVNTLQGVIVFFVFVVKDTKVRRLAWNFITMKKEDTRGTHTPLRAAVV